MDIRDVPVGETPVEEPVDAFQAKLRKVQRIIEQKCADDTERVRYDERTLKRMFIDSLRNGGLGNVVNQDDCNRYLANRRQLRKSQRERKVINMMTPDLLNMMTQD